MTAVLDSASLLCLTASALLSLAAAVGLLRFPDLLSRMHAGTKPQVLGVLLALLGVGLRLRSGLDVGMLLLVGLFQCLTLPVAAHMVGRAVYRTDLVRSCDLAVDDLSVERTGEDGRAVDGDQLGPDDHVSEDVHRSDG
ncbi:MAG TPA: monovalent cation/H(+) antiporter subunit G [Actinomycetales bacterium]|nr:monovalent cation/H(+) antiporter subunit G [Actinomycetales bacterium]